MTQPNPKADSQSPAEALRQQILHILTYNFSGGIEDGDYDDAADELIELVTAYAATVEREARLDEVRNAKVVHIDMPKDGIKKTFDDWCFIRQEEINDGKPARYEYKTREIDEYNRRFKS